MISRKLEYLIALSKEGHFARAAAACSVSQPALSAGIQQLEQELGVSIVKRGQRFQGFTEQGEIVLAWANQMESQCKRLYQELKDSRDHLAGTLRIGLLNSTAPFASIFTIAFTRRFPEVNLVVSVQSPYNIQQGIEEGLFDVAITYLDQQSPESRSYFLYTQEYYFLTKQGSKHLPPKAIDWDDLKGIPLCIFPSETQVYGMEVVATLGSPHPNTPRIETNNMMVLLGHVGTGEWASVLPKPVLFMIAGSDEFTVMPLPRTPEAGGIGIVVPQRKTESPLAEAFFRIATSPDVLTHFQAFNEPSSTTLRMLPR